MIRFADADDEATTEMWPTKQTNKHEFLDKLSLIEKVCGETVKLNDHLLFRRLF